MLFDFLRRLFPRPQVQVGSRTTRTRQGAVVHTHAAPIINVHFWRAPAPRPTKKRSAGADLNRVYGPRPPKPTPVRTRTPVRPPKAPPAPSLHAPWEQDPDRVPVRRHLREGRPVRHHTRKVG